MPATLSPGAGRLAGDAVEAVEDVGDGDLEDQGGQALLVVVPGGLVPDLVRYRVGAVGQAGGGLGEGEGGALGVGEVGGLAPGGDGGHALRGLGALGGARHAGAAGVDLADPQVD